MSKELNHSFVPSRCSLYSYSRAKERVCGGSRFSRSGADIICNSGDFYIRADSRTRRRPVSRNANVWRLSFAELTSPAEYKRGCTDTTHRQRNFLFARGETPSTAPLLLPAREIRYEVYPCIFEDRRCCTMLGRACCGARQTELSRPIYSCSPSPSACPRRF